MVGLRECVYNPMLSSSLRYHCDDLSRDYVRQPMTVDNDREDPGGYDRGAEEEAALLSTIDSKEEEEDLVVHSGSPAPLLRQQSSFAQTISTDTPRTSAQLRLDVDDSCSQANGHTRPTQVRSPDWVEDEDYLSTSDGHATLMRGQEQRLPLLTDIEAPSVTVATSGESDGLGFRAEDLLESARPKSGIASAFMNMANSIM